MKNLQKLIVLSFTLILTLSGIGFGQEKPIRIEGKFGVPNIVGGSVEYLLPELGNEFIDNSIAPYVDFSAFGLTLDETTDMGFTYFGFGGKYYLDQQVKSLGLPGTMQGVFGGLGFGRMSLELTDNEWFSFEHGDGTATGSIGTNMFQIKLGKRWIWGPLTVCVETGYALGSMDDKVKVDIEYDDGTTETDTEDISDVPLGVGTIGALSIGIAL